MQGFSLPSNEKKNYPVLSILGLAVNQQALSLQGFTHYVQPWVL